MKKLMFLSLVLVSANCFSQGFVKGIANRLSFGLRGGANYSDFSNANFETEGLVGFHAGGFVNFRMSNHFSIQEEFVYSTQGAKLKGGAMDGKDIKLAYIQVPIMLKYKTSFGLFLEAGPQVGIKVNEDFKSLGISSDTDYAEKIDGGLIGGIGYQFKKGLGIDARYYLSMTDISKTTITGINKDFRNNALQVGIFYTF